MVLTRNTVSIFYQFQLICYSSIYNIYRLKFDITRLTCTWSGHIIFSLYHFYVITLFVTKSSSSNFNQRNLKRAGIIYPSKRWAIMDSKCFQFSPYVSIFRKSIICWSDMVPINCFILLASGLRPPLHPFVFNYHLKNFYILLCVVLLRLVYVHAIRYYSIQRG